MADDYSTYDLTTDDKPRGRYVPPPESRPERKRRVRREPFWARVMAWDPFPVIMLVSVLLWVAMGLFARKWPPMGLILFVVGLLVCFVGQLYLYALIFQEGYEHGILSFLFDWYKFIFLQFNIELTLKPSIIMLTGLFMSLTGMFVFLNNIPKPPGT
jgi:hypothetical protein